MVYDFSPNGFNATYGATAGIAGVYGPMSPYNGFLPADQTALLCTAGDLTSSVTVPYLNLQTNAVTFAMWISPNANEVTYTGLLMNRDSGGDAAGFGFGGTTSGGMPGLGYTWNTNSGSTWGFSSGLYPQLGIWSFAALVVQSNAATIYLYYIDNSGNTQLQSAVNQIAHDPEWFGDGLIMLGSDVNPTSIPAANNVFAGGISDAAVFNKSLSSDQILALFAAGVGVSGFAPAITGQPQSEYVFAGLPAQISAAGINGTANLSYQWTLNGTDVNLLADKANFTGANSNILTIASVAPADAGTYQLVVTNLYGTNYSSNAVLVI
ncbi:MAG: LamG-like jellyroll fold domain-containing protein, partial [Verrucomicrobiota bacterium]